ncbi:hypothetical protein [Desulfitobacterium sp. THU1]|uniref:hypothetical protein n=1 Tax=Desulfitobacterium sp. THU1 TaxID=3138072 RepID=UPI0031204CC0
MNGAPKIGIADVWHPRHLYQDVIGNVGQIPQFGTVGVDPELVEKAMIPCWANYMQWQADAINHLIKQEGYEVVFSHMKWNVGVYGNEERQQW